jgi:hypothetical protein
MPRDSLSPVPKDPVRSMQIEVEIYDLNGNKQPRPMPQLDLLSRAIAGVLPAGAASWRSGCDKTLESLALALSPHLNRLDDLLAMQYPW